MTEYAQSDDQEVLTIEGEDCLADLPQCPDRYGDLLAMIESVTVVRLCDQTEEGGFLWDFLL